MCPQKLPTPIVVDVSEQGALDWKKEIKPPELIMRTAERQDQLQGQLPDRPGTSDQILNEIRDYCRATQTAESTFGRLVVNDGKLVSRLRDGARITTGTLDKVRSYLSEHGNAAASSRPSEPAAQAKP